MVSRKTMALVFANMHDRSVPELTEIRSMASLPFGGRYRLIDFLLSSFVHAGITDVGVIVKSNYHSLMDHLGTGREWDLARKIEGLSTFPPFSSEDSNAGVYHGRMGALFGIINHIRGSNAKYVIMADCDHVANFDTERYVEEHIKSGADISMVCCKLPWAEDLGRNCVCVSSDETGRVTDLFINSRCDEGGAYSMNIFVLERSLLESIIENAHSHMYSNFERDVLLRNISRLNLHCIMHDGYVRRIYNNKSYFDASMSLLEPEARAALFPKGKAIYTKVRDNAPVKYGLNAEVTNSLLADGCIIDGKVENSVLFRGVTVEKGAVVKNCILMQDTHISSGAFCDCVITDKQVVVGENRELSGHISYPIYIKKFSKV